MYHVYRTYPNVVQSYLCQTNVGCRLLSNSFAKQTSKSIYFAKKVSMESELVQNISATLIFFKTVQGYVNFIYTARGQILVE